MDNKQAKKLSKRQALREERARQVKRQRILIIGGILLFIAVIITLIITSSLGGVGNITAITPEAYQNENGAKLGDPNAKVVIDVFEDFKCPHCKTFTLETEPIIIAELVGTGQVFYVFHNFPFLVEGESNMAALGAMCAAEQNRLYDFKKIIFTNAQFLAGEYTEKKMVAFADSLNLKMDQFRKCMSDKSYQTEIDADLALGKQMGVQGTPSIFVNGVDVAPGVVPTFAQIKAAVEAALNK
jgi:protein-disulfide isomerase